jgi:hypothetical protein
MLKAGESALFRAYDRRLIYGKVIAVINPGVYLVLADHVCTTYSDGMYRFSDRNVVRSQR